MLTAKNNDILFDDLLAIGSMHLSSRSANTSISYGDCGNRFEVETAENLSLNGDCTHNNGIINSYGDCGN